MKEEVSKIKKIILFILLVYALVGCSSSGQDIDDDYSLTDQDLESIEKYLEQNLTTLSRDDGEIQSAFEVFGSDFTKGEIYIWATALEFYNGGSQSTSGVSVPVVIKVNQEDHQLQVIGHSIPRDGNLYSRDLNKLFPEHIRESIKDFDSKNQMDQLLEQI